MRPRLWYRLAWTVPPMVLLVLALRYEPVVPERTGNVLHVVDGDTLFVKLEGVSVHVRLSRIDCPELDQPWGIEAQRYLAKLVSSRDVRLLPETRDRYGRLIARVQLPDGREVGEELLQAGMAWHFRRYSRDPRLDRLEDQARTEHRGLWSDAEAIAPWRWRRVGRGG